MGWDDKLWDVAQRSGSGVQQVNLRLPYDLYEVLQALVFLEGRGGPDLLLDVVREHLEARRAEPHVQRLLAEKVDYHQGEAEVRRLRPNSDGEARQEGP